MSASQVVLSCQQCQKRKTKCNKKDPCSSCTAAGIECRPVKRTRLPRGRSGNKASARSALRERVGRLESLLTQAQDGTLGTKMQNVSMAGDDATRIYRTHHARLGMEPFVASDFWEELAGTVSGLRDILQEPDEADFDDETPTTTVSISEPSENGMADAHSLLFGHIDASAVPLDHRNTPHSVKHRMLSTYHKRVDAIFKVLHWPTAAMAIQMLQHSGYDKPSCGAPSVLEAAVYFLAVCSLHDTEIEQRRELAQHYRAITERAFARCNLLITTNIIVLQAFVIYLAGLRAFQANAQQWTLMATAIRLASAQNIPSYSGSTECALTQENQRRVWHCIGLLDLQSAFDRGTQPMLRSNDFRAAPLNVDDIDLYWGLSVSELQPRERAFTEMSFSVTVNRAMVCQTRLIETGMSAASSPDATEAFLVRDQRALLAGFESQVTELKDLCGQNPTPIQQYTMAVATESLVAMHLLIYRPLHKRGRASWTSDDTADDKPDILRMATDVLERSLNKRSLEPYQQWAWFSWVKWYALAIVLVELCCCSHFSPLAERAWEAAVRSYDDYAQAVADTQAGLLWKPIVKLMRNARTVRANARGESQVLVGHVNQNLPLPGSNVRAPYIPFAESVTGLPLSAPAGTADDSSRDQHDTATIGSDVDMSWLQWEALVADIYLGDDFMDIHVAWDTGLLSTFASQRADL